ncbi:CHASE2 domain-containing protein [Ampullimonas aquatilis]|uniref:CHASE2 domain-containing protein n=1 Tax=Ampullimonas aquatilis TaxID=1341549 RepID=UPI003C78A031
MINRIRQLWGELRCSPGRERLRGQMATQLLNRHWPRYLIGITLVISLLLHATGYGPWIVVQKLEQWIYDSRLVALMPQSRDPHIVILDIDEKSLSEYGRWPWSRNKLANLIETLFEQQKIALLGFDMVFGEPDTSSGLATLELLAQKEFVNVPGFREKLNGLKPQLDYDAQFREALKKYPVVLSFYLTNTYQSDILLPSVIDPITQEATKSTIYSSGRLPNSVLPSQIFEDTAIHIAEWDAYRANLQELGDASLGAGFFNPIVDPDGKVRQVPLIAAYRPEKGQPASYQESFALAMLRAGLGSPPLQPNLVSIPLSLDAITQWIGTGKPYRGIESFRLAVKDQTLQIPVDNHAEVLIPYRGKPGRQGGSFSYYSAADVLSKRVPPETLKGKIVLVGTTAQGLMDLRNTPVAEVYPGVEIHASLLSGMLERKIKSKPDFSIGYEVGVILLLGLPLAIALPTLSAVAAILLTFLAVTSAISLNLWLYEAANMALPLASILVLLFLLLFFNIVYGYLIESRTKRELARLFGSYVPPELVEEMARDPRSYSMQGSSKELTVMFADVRNFTSISESLDPQDLREFINSYLTEMTMVIQRHRGTLDKYVGDGIMAFWGAPITDEQHAEHAVRNALAMRSLLKKFNRRMSEIGLPKISIGIGINSGVMSVGDMGSKIRRAYTVVGDAVNLASRLESLSKYYGVSILVGEQTRQKVPGIVFREIDTVCVHGKEIAVRLFEPISYEKDVNNYIQEELDIWHRQLEHYRNGHWSEAMQELTRLLKRNPESRLYRLFETRLQKFNHTPPVSWNGITYFDAK